MGIINGLFSGRAGIQSHGAAISVLADNIANANTIGYKASRADFADLLAGGLGGSSSALSVGSGSKLNAVTQIFNQGSVEFTGRGLDLAIEGNGFLIVDNGGVRMYSRAGNLSVDPDGFLRDQNNNQVLGFAANGAGGLEALNVNEIAASSVSTGSVTIGGNLDASASITAVPGGTPTFAQLATASTFSTFVDIYDSLGAKHSVTAYFFKTAAGTWTANAYVDGSEVSGGTAGQPTLIGSTTTLAFDSSGARTSVPASDFSASVAWASGADPGSIDFLFDPMTQFATSSSIASISQDGSGTGSVVSFSVEADGTLFALLNNGLTSSIGTVAVASFANPEGLRRSGNSLFQASSDSGEPIIGTPNTGQFGAVQSGALELSTSDIADDFIKLISLQRGFQGSSRIITSINDLLDEVINLAR